MSARPPRWTGTSGSFFITLLVLVAASALTVQFVGPGSGTYRAASTTHELSTTPPRIHLWHGSTQRIGHLGTSTPWVNILGNIDHPAGVASATFQVNGGMVRPLSIGPDERRLQETGDFNVEVARAELALGQNTVVIHAKGRDGLRSRRTVYVERLVDRSASLPHSVDWAAYDSVLEAADVSDGRWRLESGGVRTTQVGYDRVLVVGERTWRDYEVTAEVTVHDLGNEWGTPQSGAPLVGLILRWPGNTNLDGEQPSGGFFPMGAFAWHRFHPEGGRFELISSDWEESAWEVPHTRSESMLLDRAYVFKARVEETRAGARYRFKFWLKDEPEPGWGLALTYDGGAPQGAVGLVAHHVDATFGSVRIAPLE